MLSNIHQRNNVTILGEGTKTILFAAGFGCDQTVWRDLLSAFQTDYRIVLFDYVGFGGSDIQAFHESKYSKMDGYVQDVLDICEDLELSEAIFIGHSVSGMIGLLASLKKPEYFSELIMIGPSPCYLNDPPAYYGGFEKEDLEGLIELMEKNFIGWANMFAMTVTNNSEKPHVAEELEDRFCSTDPFIARTFAQACFFADLRDQLVNVSVSSLILQCRNDVIAPTAVGEYLHKKLKRSSLVYMEATGHCPHMSHPEETLQHICDYLSTR